MTFNLATILRESRCAAPGKPLCHSQHTTLTYEQVDEASGRVAAALLALGLRRGDRVAVQLPNVPEFLLCYFGILKAGLIMVPLNPLLKGREIAYHLRDSGSRILVGFSHAGRRGDSRRRGGRRDRGLHGGPARARPDPGAAPGRHQALRRPARRRGHRRDRADRRRRHRRRAVHQRHDRQAQGRRADPLPALHELHGLRRPVRDRARRRQPRGPPAVPRLRPVQRAERRGPLRRHDGAGPALRDHPGPGRDREAPLHHLLRRPDDVLRAAARRHRRPRPERAARRLLRRRGRSPAR